MGLQHDGYPIIVGLPAGTQTRDWPTGETVIRVEYLPVFETRSTVAAVLNGSSAPVFELNVTDPSPVVEESCTLDNVTPEYPADDTVLDAPST